MPRSEITALPISFILVLQAPSGGTPHGFDTGLKSTLPVAGVLLSGDFQFAGEIFTVTISGLSKVAHGLIVRAESAAKNPAVLKLNFDSQ